MTWQTQILLGQDVASSPLVGLIFCATLVIYALHRIVGISKVTDLLDIERFHVIRTYQSHILLYAIIATAIGSIFFFYLNTQVQITLILPALLSVAYVLPFIGKKREKRLRDIHFIKIFLIAIVWAYVTVLLPAVELGLWQKNKYGSCSQNAAFLYFALLFLLIFVI